MEDRTAKSYREAEDFLAEVPKFTRKNPMEATRNFYEFIQACEAGAISEKKLGKIIHVAGTNGKGSVCAFLQQICMSGGYHVGMFTSPHLITTRERFCIDGDIISEELFLEAFLWLEDKITVYQKTKSDYNPTYFERLFFMGVYVFSNADVEVTILETGLGGRLDTTNVIKTPSVSIITEIGLDHMEYLGDTIEQIAGEKAGIIRPGVPVVFCDRKNEVSVVLERKAADCGSVCHRITKNDYKINEIQKKYIDFSVSSRYYCYGRLTLKGTALYQVENAAIAIRACEILIHQCGLDRITVPAIVEGIQNMRWPGRMEEIMPRVYIDGAHNVDGIEAFVQSVNRNREVRLGDKCFLVFSAVKDKQLNEMVKQLCGISQVTDFVVTRIPQERGADLSEMKKQFEQYTDKRIYVFEKIEDAICFAMKGRSGNDVIYIVGSLYLAGIVKEISIMFCGAGMEDYYDKL